MLRDTTQETVEASKSITTTIDTDKPAEKVIITVNDATGEPAQNYEYGVEYKDERGEWIVGWVGKSENILPNAACTYQAVPSEMRVSLTNTAAEAQTLRLTTRRLSR